ncbi:hypothetical protein GALL_536300 [mine drainage metagenome]|uniref:Uncharacterized protein n=1 Tax=mine drainage metagenome TaxID=410659 RepID=A0A1J5PHR4_9ZZZZ
MSSQRKGFGRVVRDMQRGGAGVRKEQVEVAAQFLACQTVHRRQRLVQQHQRGLRRQRPTDRHPLALPARQGRGTARAQSGQADALEQPLGLLRTRWQTPAAQRKQNVVDHAQMRPERGFLEHHAEPACLGRHLHAGRAVKHHGVADTDATVMRLDETRHRAQQGALARTRPP